MNLFFHTLQWIVSLVAVGALCYFTSRVLVATVTMIREERGARYALVIFVAGMLMAATCQRVRIGFWDWPDVEYEVEAENESAVEGGMPESLPSAQLMRPRFRDSGWTNEWNVDSRKPLPRNDIYKKGLTRVDGFAKSSSTARRPKDAVLQRSVVSTSVSSRW
jgi:hypothetical protein